MSETQSGLLYHGQFGQLNLLVTASYSWIFGLLFNACNFAMIEMVMRHYVKDEKTRVKTTCFLMQLVASIACLIIYIVRWDSIFWAFKDECRAPSLAACSDAMIVTAYIVEIGKKGKSMRWTLLLHHIATIAYSIYALDQYMGELLFAVNHAESIEAAYELFYTEDVTPTADAKHRANARLTIIFAQMQLIGAGLEAPTFFALAYQKFVGYFGQKKMPSWMPREPAVLLFNFFWWLLNKGVVLPAGIIWLMVEYYKYRSEIPLSYTVVLISGIILTSVSLWATYVMYLIYLKALKRKSKSKDASNATTARAALSVDPESNDLEFATKRSQGSTDNESPKLVISPIREKDKEPTHIRKITLMCLYTIISIVSFALMLVLMSFN